MTRRRIPTCVHRTCFPRKLPEPIVRRGQPDPGVPGGTRAPRRGVERIICATSHRVPGSRLTRRPAHRGRGRGTASSVDPSHPRPRGSAPPRQPSTWLPGRSPGGGAGIAAGHPVRDIRADLLRCGGGTPDTPLSACQGHAENERADSCVPFGCASRAAPRGPRSPLGGISEERAHHPPQRRSETHPADRRGVRTGGRRRHRHPDHAARRTPPPHRSSAPPSSPPPVRRSVPRMSRAPHGGSTVRPAPWSSPPTARSPGPGSPGSSGPRAATPRRSASTASRAPSASSSPAATPSTHPAGAAHSASTSAAAAPITS